MKFRKSFITITLALATITAMAQDLYKDSMEAFIINYIEKHDVVTGNDKKYLQFYPVNKNYRVIATFERVKDGKWFSMETSGTQRKVFRVYGIIRFTLHDTAVKLNIYQSQSLMTRDEYRDYLFIPFTDPTSGEETYASGRYIDLTFKDIVDDKVVVDFNKAYNPSCAYVSGKYNCPIPPKENEIIVAILAGEKNYGKHH